jgi:hypothetical protein
VARLVLLEEGVETGFGVSWTGGRPVVEGESVEKGYAFYRQALNRRVPQGAWTRIEEATGKGRRYCQYLLGLLRLGDNVLAMADRARITESQLRPLASGEEDVERQEQIARMAIEHELGRDQVADLVKTDDLEVAARKLAGQSLSERKRPAIRAPEQIVMDRLSAITKLLDRASRSEPAMLQVVARELQQSGDLEERKSELENLHAFLTALLDELESKFH